MQLPKYFKYNQVSIYILLAYYLYLVLCAFDINYIVKYNITKFNIYVK